MEFPEELISKHKEIISDIITKFNQIENLVKKIISSYIASNKTEFIKLIQEFKLSPLSDEISKLYGVGRVKLKYSALLEKVLKHDQ